MEQTDLKMIVKSFDELTLSELYQIIRGRLAVFVVEQDVPYQDLDGLDQHSRHLFLKVQDRVVGYLRVIEPGFCGESAHIGRLYVDEDFRGQGLAEQLMHKGIEIGKSMSGAIDIEAQTYLQHFYERLGFAATSEPFILEARPHISMTLA